MKKIVEYTGIIIIIVLFVISTNLDIIYSKNVYPFFYYDKLPFSVHKSVYTNNDSLGLTISSCNRDVASIRLVAAREFFNTDTKQTYQLPPGQGEKMVGCSESKVELLDVFSDGLPSGTYILRGTTQAYGSFTVLAVPYESQPFVFINKKENK